MTLCHYGMILKEHIKYNLYKAMIRNLMTTLRQRSATSTDRNSHNTNNNIADMTSSAFQEHIRQECSICFERLPSKPVCVLVDRHGSSCGHYFHMECSEEIVRRSSSSSRDPTCPNCRASFLHTKLVPSLKVDPRAWFDFIDKNHDGHLNRQEILEGLRSQLFLDWSQIDDDMDRLWYKWDVNRDNTITYEEFNNERTGLVAYLKSKYATTPRIAPSLESNPSAWFDFYDEDTSGTLCHEEVTRAVIQTFRIHHIDRKFVLSFLEQVWPIFDSDGNKVISKNEFLQTDGLGECLVAQLQAVAA